MAASFIMRTGFPNAFAKSKPTHPLPRFLGSAAILPATTGAGKPMAMASCFQSFDQFLGFGDELARPQLGPEGNLAPFDSRRNEQLHVRTADIDDQNSFPHDCGSFATVIGMSLAARSFLDRETFFVWRRERSRKLELSLLARLGSFRLQAAIASIRLQLARFHPVVQELSARRR